MYGMIHRGLREMVIEELGTAEWEALAREAGIGPAELISAQVYDDAVTTRLLMAGADRMGLSMSELLKRFGRYWLPFLVRGPYAAILDFTGRDLPTFIANLDRMHQAVVAAMPGARVASFAVTERGTGFLRVRYASERTGLEFLVIGMLEGLLDRFGLVGRVEQVATGPGGATEFLVRHDGA